MSPSLWLQHMLTHTVADDNMQALANLVRSRRSQQLEHKSTSESASMPGEGRERFPATYT